jgi:phosphoribosyl-dephospho-CoA transferase
MTAPRPHDLLRIALSPNVIPGNAPRWVHDSLARTPWVVVRRASRRRGYHPVGVRGPSRADRYAMTIPQCAVIAVATPELLGRSEITNLRRLPALDALRTVAPRLTGSGLRWGPTGAVGYELATGTPQVHIDSDLDLAIYAERPNEPTRQRLHEVDRILRDTLVRVDCQVEYPHGAVALTEIVSGVARLLLRTPHGPRLVSATGVAS